MLLAPFLLLPTRTSNLPDIQIGRVITNLINHLNQSNVILFILSHKLKDGSSKSFSIYMNEDFPLPQGPSILIVKGVVVSGDLIKFRKAIIQIEKPSLSSVILRTGLSDVAFIASGAALLVTGVTR